jgi:hypothetical protein
LSLGPGGAGFSLWVLVLAKTKSYAKACAASLITSLPKTKSARALKVSQGPGRIRAEKGGAAAGTSHANCAGQPGSVEEFRHSDVEL